MVQKKKKRISGLQIMIRIFVVLMLLLSVAGIAITLLQAMMSR